MKHPINIGTYISSDGKFKTSNIYEMIHYEHKKSKEDKQWTQEAEQSPH